jgi:hypothetical protein
VTDWQSLSVRRGLMPIPVMSEELSAALRAPLIVWLETAWGYRSAPSGSMTISFLLNIAVRANVNVTATDRNAAMTQLEAACMRDGDVFLDVIDATLAVAGANFSKSLEAILFRGNSAWTVNPNRDGLQSRVDPTAVKAAVSATSPIDEASQELKEAWEKAYGLVTNASDAWDHSIKAVEAVLIPIVTPKKDKANLGSVAGELKANRGGWTFTLGPIETVEGMIRFMWPNPDRHAAAADRRTPSLQESRAVLQTAITLVSWGRDGLIAKP